MNAAHVESLGAFGLKTGAKQEVEIIDEPMVKQVHAVSQLVIFDLMEIHTGFEHSRTGPQSWYLQRLIVTPVYNVCTCGGNLGIWPAEDASFAFG